MRKMLKKVAAAPPPRRRAAGRATPGRTASRPPAPLQQSRVRLVRDDKEAPSESDVGKAVDAGHEADPAMDSVAELEAVGADSDEAEVAEAEAEAEPEAAPEKARSRRDDEPSNFLALYFREMARLSVLRPEQEFESAREIEQMEIELWARLLAFTGLTDHLLKVVERTIENSLPEFRLLRRAVADQLKKSTVAGDERVQRTALKTAERLRALDIDKRYLEIAVEEVKYIAHSQKGLLAGRVVTSRIDFSTRLKSFREYLREALTLAARIHRAKNEFVKANLRLVVSIARRFNHGRMPLADLIQEGNIGLIKAVERYDYRRGYRFSTYASWWIRHAISRALADKGRAVRLPVHMIDAYHRVARSKRELTGKLGRQPTSEELGEATGIAAAKIEKMRTYLLDQSFSLDKPISDDDGRKFIDFIPDPNAETAPTDRLIDAAMSSEVRDLLEQLKPIEADILRQRFGLDSDKELTLKEIGEKYNLSRERIRQLQEQALDKMRRALQRKDMM
ncbi:MAG: sigma-70 family RNA polymerase sigma factor [Myxococcales bacterium]|nr:sigma-70 family RNA polymerase sigma factor [Myxococcales bacterium]